jgi:hypothetical protein
MSRTTITDDLATTMSFVKKLPLCGSCSIRPTFSQARSKMARPSRSWDSGEIESS